VHEFDARSDTADGEVFAEFDAMRATALSGKGSVQRFHADFQQIVSFHLGVAD
jgi:hypothetical protein